MGSGSVFSEDLGALGSQEPVTVRGGIYPLTMFVLTFLASVS